VRQYEECAHWMTELTASRPHLLMKDDLDVSMCHVLGRVGCHDGGECFINVREMVAVHVPCIGESRVPRRGECSISVREMVAVV